MITGKRRDLKAVLTALADDTRLRMVGFLGQGEHTGKELAELLGVKEPTVSYHISKLRSVGLLNIRGAGNQKFYRLNEDNLRRFKETVQNLEAVALDPPESDDSWIDDVPLSDEDKKVLKDYTEGGKLRQIPVKEKKFLSVLAWLILKFEADRTYAEKEVNAVITPFHHDYAALRRGMIEYGFLRRERNGSRYWVTPEDEIEGRVE